LSGPNSTAGMDQKRQVSRQ